MSRSESVEGQVRVKNVRVRSESYELKDLNNKMKYFRLQRYDVVYCSPIHAPRSELYNNYKILGWTEWE